MVQSLAITAVLLSSGFITVKGSCGPSERCIGIRSCPALVDRLQQAKAAGPAEKARIIVELREKVCGAKVSRTVCCPAQAQADPLTRPSGDSGNKELGTFVNIWHDIAGTVHKVDDTTLLIKNFNYDGQGPDAFFLAGTSGIPSKKGEVVIPYPNKDKTYNYLDTDIPILGRFTGNKDVELKLPKGWKVDDLKWLSVWCRDFVIDFGNAVLDG